MLTHRFQGYSIPVACKTKSQLPCHELISRSFILWKMKIMSTSSIPQRNKVCTLNYLSFCLLVLHLYFYFLSYFNIYMKNTFIIEFAVKSETLISNSILPIYKPKIMLKFMKNKSLNAKLKQSEIAKKV